MATSNLSLHGTLEFPVKDLNEQLVSPLSVPQFEMTSLSVPQQISIHQTTPVSIDQDDYDNDTDDAGNNKDIIRLKSTISALNALPSVERDEIKKSVKHILMESF
eukprot:230920_1